MPHRRRRPELAPPFTSESDIPLVLKLPDMARARRKSSVTIRRQLHAGTFRPLPFETAPAFLWHKQDLLDYFAAERLAAVSRPARRRRLVTHVLALIVHGWPALGSVFV